MEKINNYISKLKHYLLKYQAFIFYSLILLGLLLSFSSLPYINILLADNLAIFMITVFWIISFVLFQPSYKVSFILAIMFCFFAYFLSIIGLWTVAEIAGDVIYVVFVTGVLQMITFQFKKERVKQGD